MFTEAQYFDLISVYGQEKIKERISYFDQYLKDFTNHFPTITFENKENSSTILAISYFQLHNIFVKPYIREDKYSNSFKIASCTIFTILNCNLLFENNKDPRDTNLKFALFCAEQILFNFNTKIYSAFNSYLNNRVEVLNDIFDNLQEHNFYFLKHFTFEENKALPIILYSLFLQSFYQWLQFSHSGIQGLEL